MAYPLYDYRASIVTVVLNPTFTLLLSSNVYRICAIVTSISTGGILLTDREATDAKGSLACFIGPGMIVMPYRDYGPAIQQEIWGCALAAISSDLGIIEVFSVPRG
jgi:hypothetical protein